MAITYKWVIKQLDCLPEVGGETDVVFNVHWIVIGTEDSYSARVYGSTNLILDAEAPFTPYDQLTPEQLIAWVKDAISKDDEKADPEEIVKQQIEKKKQPIFVKPELPWAGSV